MHPKTTLGRMRCRKPSPQGFTSECSGGSAAPSSVQGRSDPFAQQTTGPQSIPESCRAAGGVGSARGNVFPRLTWSRAGEHRGVKSTTKAVTPSGAWQSPGAAGRDCERLVYLMPEINSGVSAVTSSVTAIPAQLGSYLSILGLLPGESSLHVTAVLPGDTGCLCLPSPPGKGREKSHSHRASCASGDLRTQAVPWEKQHCRSGRKKGC